MSTEQLDLNNQLILACRSGIIERIKKLLDDGADINGPNVSGQRPLIMAVQNYNTGIVKYLLDKGANIHITHGVYRYSAIDVARTPDIVKLLIDRGANIESVFNGMTPLHNAVSNDNTTSAEYLLDAGANIEAVIHNNSHYDDNTPLMVAVNDADYNMCEFLIHYGANVNYETPRTKTCLSIACAKGLYRIAHLLIENGANVNHKDGHGRTPLMFACMYADIEYHKYIIQLLIKNGGDIYIRDNAGYDVFDYVSSGTRILSGNVTPFNPIGSRFRNEHMDEIIDLLTNKINNNVRSMEKTLRQRGMDKNAAQTIAIEHFDPRSLSVHSEIREEHRLRKSKSKKGGKRKSKRSRTRRMRQ